MKPIDPRHLLRRATLALCLLALGGLPLPGTSGAGLAADDKPEEKRRVLKAYQLDQSAASVSEEYRRMAEEKRMESIRRLKELISRGVEGETKAEMMLRLADLYFQQGRDLYLREMEQFDQQYERCFDDENCNPDNMQPNNVASQEWQVKSIKLYESILRNYPRYQRADQATFFLGSALQDTGRSEEAVEAFKKLVKLYPQSGYVPDSYVLIGEYYFDHDNAYGALRAYLKATAYKDSQKYPFAMYKLGWCYYNVGDYGKSIETMKAVVSYSMAQVEADTGSLQLQEEALKDLVRFFADAGAMDEAYEYFNKLGKKELIRSMLQRLAGMYFEQGKFDQSIETYRRLILEDPQSADNPEYQVEIINAYRKVGQRDRTLEEIDRLNNDYGATSAWARANASDPNAVADAQDKIESQLRRTATDYHNTARQYTKSRHPDAKKVYGLARDGYQTYLQVFPDNEHTYDVRYAYAELLYTLKDYQGAFDQYMAVVDIDPNGKHSRFCAESAIFAAEEQVKIEGGGRADGTAVADASKSIEPQALTEWETRLVSACSKYAELYPDDKKVRNIIYKSAYLLYNKYRFDEAATQFRVVIQMDPGSKEAEQAANLILDSLNVRKDWAALKENSKFYYDTPGLGGTQFKKDVYAIYESSSFKLVEVNFEKTKDYAVAADGFMAFYTEFPDSKIAAQALNNSSVYYYEAGKVADSMKVRHILVEDPKFGPETKYYYDQIGALGFDYETIANFERAAFYYEKLWGLYPEERKEKKDDEELVAKMDEKAADAIYSAAVFRSALGDWDVGIDNYNQFVAAFPDDKRVADTRLRVGGIYEDHEKWEDAANVFHGFYTKPPEDAPLEFQYFARLHYGRALGHMGQLKKRDKVYAETVVMYEKEMAKGGQKGPHTEFVAEMMYELAQPQLEEYLALKIEARKGVSRKLEDKSLADSLSKKAQALLETDKTFTEVVQLGAGEFGLAATVSLGKAYENMGDSLRTGDLPSYLTEEQRELYTMAIEDKVYVQEEKALNAYQLALEKSYELTLYNDNTAYAVRRLGELRPDDFPGLQEQLIDPRWTSTKKGGTVSDDFETTL